ncbi:uncharacterized protein At1g28695-like isoform X1 [Zingiber officinale]|uniref:uncharacterized protein At1g28695-like isoform X1 n=1 Tax=Zingiber officinale TaxID=94328 RepID=UPI001C4C05B1|nr:uncharacterized protein At1g28695-like isoform X1 [Zingiber officinale]
MAVGSKARITISSLLFFSVVLYAAMWLPVSLPTRLTALLRFEHPLSPVCKKQALRDELDIALEETSMDNKMLIIAILNRAYMGENGMLDLFLQSLHQGEKTEFLINHLLLVAVDQLAFNQCKILQLHCYHLVSDSASFSKEAFYMSDDFIKMMWRRTQFLREVLRRGYSFIFTDMDILWLRNPLTKLSGGEDLQISCDKYNSQRPFDAASNFINTGFYFISANKRTIAMFDHWNGATNRSLGMKDQDVLLKLNIEGVLGKLGVRVKYLDNNYFSGFCHKSRDFRKVITMHANCCVGTKAKLIDLRAFFEAWKIHNGTSNATWPAHKSCLFAKNRKLISESASLHNCKQLVC